MNVFFKSKNKTRVPPYPPFYFTDSSRTSAARPLRHSKKRLEKRKAQKKSAQTKQWQICKTPIRYPHLLITIKLSKSLKFIPIPPKQSYQRFQQFHQEQPPSQPSGTPENYMVCTKDENARIAFCDSQDKLSGRTRILVMPRVIFITSEPAADIPPAEHSTIPLVLKYHPTHQLIKNIISRDFLRILHARRRDQSLRYRLVTRWSKAPSPTRLQLMRTAARSPVTSRCHIFLHPNSSTWTHHF